MPLGGLPPKDKYTLVCLTSERETLVGLIRSHCLRGNMVWDFARAGDYLRSYVCSIFNLLKTDYSKKVHFFRTIEDWTAREAVQIVLKCWEELNLPYKPEHWESAVRDAIEQHIGHQLVDVVKQGAPLQPAEPTKSEAASEIERRAKLLSDYKQSTGASNKQIYEARNSGIHKPEFYQWMKGHLPSESKTTKALESFLKARRRPIPRKPTM